MDRFLWLWRPLGLLLLAGCGLPMRGDMGLARELADPIDRLDAHVARDPVPTNPAAPPDGTAIIPSYVGMGRPPLSMKNNYLPRPFFATMGFPSAVSALVGVSHLVGVSV